MTLRHALAGIRTVATGPAPDASLQAPHGHGLTSPGPRRRSSVSQPTRNTKQRNAIRAVFDESNRPLGPQEVLDRGRAEVPNMSLATVYRTISVLLEEGEIARVDVPGQTPLYEPADLKHHHHFHCEACGRTFDIQGCPGDLKKFLPKGAELTRHDLTLFGRCTDCVAAGREPGEAD
jgi:Fur family ferric uptake transcriptional regulator